MNKYRWTFLLATAFSLTTAMLSLTLGAAGLTLPELFDAVAAGPTNTAGRIFYYARLPRTAACMLGGAALAAAGCVIQAVLNNQLASPGIIGVNAGAGLAVTVCCAIGTFSGWVIAGASFLGAMAAVTLVMVVSQKTGVSRSTVILSGVAINSVLNGLSEAVTTLVPDAAATSVDFRVGGFASVSHLRLIPAGVLILIALAALFSLCSELDVISLGEETARGLGLNVRRMRILFLVLAALLCGAAVSFSGLLGFVGLIAPHAVRALVGSESRKLLPLSALLGAGFVTACDLAARLVFRPYELPVGIIMSVIGGPFFLWLLYKRRGGRRDD